MKKDVKLLEPLCDLAFIYLFKYKRVLFFILMYGALKAIFIFNYPRQLTTLSLCTVSEAVELHFSSVELASFHCQKHFLCVFNQEYSSWVVGKGTTESGCTKTSK